MKYRLGWVSNSSSSSFILLRALLTPKQEREILGFIDKEGFYRHNVTERHMFLFATGMADTDDLLELMKKRKVPQAAIWFAKEHSTAQDEIENKYDWFSTAMFDQPFIDHLLTTYPDGGND